MKYTAILLLATVLVAGASETEDYTVEQSMTTQPAKIRVDPDAGVEVSTDGVRFHLNGIDGDGNPVMLEYHGEMIEQVSVELTVQEWKAALSAIGETPNTFIAKFKRSLLVAAKAKLKE